METPKGIFYWSGRAKSEAEIDGTIGIAQDDNGMISHIAVAEPWAGAKVMERAAKGKVFAYAPIEGMESLRKKWLARILSKHPGLTNYATLPVVTNGITHALAIDARLLLENGQTLITPDKSWENYEHIFRDVQGVKISTFPLFTNRPSRSEAKPITRPQGATASALHIDALIGACREVAQLQKKVVLLLNFPHNQTGFMPSADDAKELGQRIQKLCREMPEVPFVVLLDDAYEGYVYDETGQKLSLLSEIFLPLPNLSVAKMDGISKVMLAYGYRIGFLTFFTSALDGHLMHEEFLAGLRNEMGSKIGGFIRGEISQVNHHGQILADALMDDLATVETQRGEIISRLRDRWKAMMAALEEGYKKYGKQKLWADPCNGGFFAYLNLEKGIDAKEIAERLLKEKKVGVVPSQQGLRVAFCGVPPGKIGKMIQAIFEVTCAAGFK